GATAPARRWRAQGIVRSAHVRLRRGIEDDGADAEARDVGEAGRVDLDRAWTGDSRIGFEHGHGVWIDDRDAARVHEVPGVEDVELAVRSQRAGGAIQAAQAD